jgi:hypothetical protein
VDEVSCGALKSESAAAKSGLRGIYYGFGEVMWERSSLRGVGCGVVVIDGISGTVFCLCFVLCAAVCGWSFHFLIVGGSFSSFSSCHSVSLVFSCGGASGSSFG